jgi:hypothetical protein
MRLTRRHLLQFLGLSVVARPTQPAGWTLEVLTPTGLASLAHSTITTDRGRLSASFQVAQAVTAEEAVVRRGGTEIYRWQLESLRLPAGGSVGLQVNPRV